MLKQALRTKYKALRNNLSSEQVQALSLTISNKLLEIPIWSYSYYHIFLSATTKNEIDTSFILSILQGKDKNVVVPKVATDHSFLNYLLTDTILFKENQWGIPEPIEGIEVPTQHIEVVFLPLLAFDIYGNRVGYGKGYYDNFLQQCNPSVLKIGLSFFAAEPLISDLRGGDIPLDYGVTPDKIYTF
ncbi:5-formyltetrahydrofolate cyclo-ligase [Arenibacter sp. GZD96]|uniref:5-formyltetrahydrofolate cyclo-ligase n=1 Tax=Aurantibrevibacter litoralis TaxID=3106030 RepID=UPI002AFEEFA9|nr:5-formyltetrahydrofolate cyclo-ligase [Arenibacter sp. GZD-96]MEA1786561.1 5-formyltetrahydrofolate cyclo-ligase [Arenibacter sp. GZD-96]